MNRLIKKFRHDLFGIGLIALGVFIGLALLSFNPADPSLNSSGHSLKVLNYCGYVGSFLADGFFQLFGLSAWLFAAGLLRMGFLSFQGEALSIKDLRLVWGSLLVLTLSSLVATYFPQTKLYDGQIYLGGIVGLGLSQVLLKALNHIGVQVILWSLTAVLVVFYSEKTVNELAEVPLKILAKLKKIRWTLPRPKNSPSLPRISKLKAKKEVVEEVKPKKTELPPQFIPLKAELQESIDEVEEISAQNDEPPSLEENREPQRRKVVMKTKISRRIENWELPKISMLEDPPATRFKIDEKENEMTENDIDTDEEFDPIGIAAGVQRVVFIFDGEDEAESYLKRLNVEFKKQNMAWQVNLSTKLQ
jgi:S-DNA-T family DNA segregation ATPase FtsK/SpoIIIE